MRLVSIGNFRLNMLMEDKMASMIAQMESQFINDLALLVKEDWAPDTQYRKGWLDGFAVACWQVTGMSRPDLIRNVNKVLEGSGKVLVDPQVGV
jgi:hypothetical protein